jgi:hypothetical protein
MRHRDTTVLLDVVAAACLSAGVAGCATSTVPADTIDHVLVYVPGPVHVGDSIRVTAAAFTKFEFAVDFGAPQSWQIDDPTTASLRLLSADGDSGVFVGGLRAGSARVTATIRTVAGVGTITVLP